MPTFDRLVVPIIIASLIGGGLTGVLAAQTGDSRSVSATATEDSAATPAPMAASLTVAKPARSLFAEGVDAYRKGNLELAVARWGSAAEEGDLAAQWNLARIYLGHDKMEADRARALTYLRAVAAQHDPDLPPGPRTTLTVEALVELGVLYWQGVPEAGLPPSPELAVPLFEHAATLYGHPRAQHYLGLMYLKGEGVTQHVGRAIRWLVLAANKRYAPSQAALGDYFWQSTGDDDHRVQGLMWFALASENAKGEDVRAKFLDRYNTALTEADEAERARATTLVESWNARYAAAGE